MGEDLSGDQDRRPLAEASADVVGDILGLLAHDLRNPLAALSSNVGFLSMLSSDLTEDANEAIEDLQLSVEALGRIIDSLELVCNELKQCAAPARVVVTVKSVVDAIAPQAMRAAESHGVTLELSTGNAFDERISVSTVLFGRAVSALLHNALTAAPARSVITMIVERQGDDVVFRVEDDGASLAEELSAAALSAEGQSQVKTEAGGRYSRGMGLYVASRSAELSGARFRVGETQSGSRLEIVVEAV